jgi:hypothetical protein
MFSNRRHLFYFLGKTEEFEKAWCLLENQNFAKIESK